MPWSIQKDTRCPASKPYGVVKDADNELEGCHVTQEAAKKQLAALNASESRTYEFRMEPASDGLTLEGYAAVYDSPADVVDWEGEFTEVIKPGAFARAVRQNPRPVLQFDHGQHPLLGSIPIGAIKSLREDARGLFVSAKLHDNWLTEPVRDAIAEGSITGMSFRFTVPDGGDEWSRGDSGRLRTLHDVDVLELGPVVWPAYADTAVSVRSKEIAAALEDPDIRHDFSIALLLGTQETPTADVTDDVRTSNDTPIEEAPTSEETEAVREDVADPPDGVSAPNPARRYATEFAVRAALAAQRSTSSHHGIEGLSDP